MQDDFRSTSSALMSALNPQYRAWSAWQTSPFQAFPTVSLARAEAFPHADSALLGFLGPSPARYILPRSPWQRRSSATLCA